MSKLQFLRDILNVGWMGSLISLIGLIAALIIYRASKIGARLVYQMLSTRLISMDGQVLPHEVEIFYKGSRVTRVTRTQIVLWNSGNMLVRGSDIVDDDPPRFVFEKSATILSATVLKVTRPATKFAVNVDAGNPNELLYRFDYLEPGDGVAIDLLHTAEQRNPVCLGTIRGIPNGILDWGSPLPVSVEQLTNWGKRSVPIIFFSLPLFGAVLIGMGLYTASWLRAPLLLFGTIYVIGGVITLREKRRAPRFLRPDL